MYILKVRPTGGPTAGKWQNWNLNLEPVPQAATPWWVIRMEWAGLGLPTLRDLERGVLEL